MPAVKTYTRVNFQNYPSTSTPLNATNLNKLDKGIDDLDDEVVTVKNAIENMSFDADSISYDNTSSGLQATDVQGAVDEINDNLSGFKFYPTGTGIVGLIADDSAYTDANGKYVVWGTPTANQLVEDNPNTYKSVPSTEDCRGEVGADSASPFSKKIEFTDFAVVGGKLSDADSMVTIPKTPNTIIDTVLTPGAINPHTYTFQPISTDTYFYVLNGTYASASVTPTTINNISVTNGVIEQLGQSYTIVVRNQSGSNNSSVAYSLFRVKGDSSCRVTIPSSYSVVGIKLIQFTI